MKNIILFSILNFLFFLILKNAFALDVMDDQGAIIHLAKPAKRIVSLSPDITEILFAIGAGDRIIATVNASDFPEVAKQIPSVGSYSGIDVERILMLHPDLIITWNNSFARHLNTIKTFGVPIYTTSPQRLEDVAKSMKHFGRITDTEAMANNVADRYLTKLSKLKKVHHDLKTIDVFFQIGSHALFTIDKNSWINQAIEFCGGRNIFADIKLRGAEVNMEAILSRKPHIIISDSRNAHWVDRWQTFNEMYAVKHQLLFAINPDWIDRAGPRLVEGVEKMCEFIDVARMKRG